MLYRIGLIVILFVSFVSCKKGKNNPESCNGKNTRRDIKICIDPLANEIDTIPYIGDIDSLTTMDVYCVKGKTERQDLEKQVVTVTGIVDDVSSHMDGDWKVRLKTANGNYLNCEAPNPGCRYIPSSRFLTEIIISREWMISRQDELEGKTVTVTGVQFLDIDHVFKRKAAINEFEIHPILDIHY